MAQLKKTGKDDSCPIFDSRPLRTERMQAARKGQVKTYLTLILYAVATDLFTYPLPGIEIPYVAWVGEGEEQKDVYESAALSLIKEQEKCRH